MESKGRVFSREITKVPQAGGLLQWISMGINDKVVSKVKTSGEEGDVARVACTKP